MDTVLRIIQAPRHSPVATVTLTSLQVVDTPFTSSPRMVELALVATILLTLCRTRRRRLDKRSLLENPKKVLLLFRLKSQTESQR